MITGAMVGVVARCDDPLFVVHTEQIELMFTKLWGIVVNCLIETIRQPIYGVLILVTIALLVLNLTIAGYTLEDDNKFNKDLGLSTLLLTGLFLAGFSAAGVLSREIENKTVLTVVSKPVSRPLFLLGKYLGLVLALAIAFYFCSIAFLLTMRHEVMERASQHLDMPVILFGIMALAGTILIAAFCNYMYDMNFQTTCVGLGLPAFTLAFLLVCLIDREWGLQPFGEDFRDGQLFAALALVFAMVMVLTAVAVAVSTRLGQVMTLTICAAVMLLGLVSDSLFGQHRDTSGFADIAYRVSPNFAYLWVTDALTQETPITLSYVGMAMGYASLLAVAWLLLGVALFQKREVG